MKCNCAKQEKDLKEWLANDIFTRVAQLEYYSNYEGYTDIEVIRVSQLETMIKMRLPGFEEWRYFRVKFSEML
jgi:hypothetical protein